MPKQQRKKEIKCVNRCEDKEWKEVKGQDTGELRMHTHRDRQATGQRQEDLDKTNEFLIRSF